MRKAYLDEGAGVDLVDCVPRGPAGLTVQVVALDKDAVVADALDPDVALPAVVQVNTLADVQSATHRHTVIQIYIMCVCV